MARQRERRGVGGGTDSCKGENVLGLYLDLKKVFDAVAYRILLQEHTCYGIRVRNTMLCAASCQRGNITCLASLRDL